MENQSEVITLDLENAILCLQFLNDTFKPETIPAGMDKRFINQYEDFKAMLTMSVNAKLDIVTIHPQHHNFYKALHTMFNKIVMEKHIKEMGLNPENVQVIVLDEKDSVEDIVNLLVGGNDSEH